MGISTRTKEAKEASRFIGTKESRRAIRGKALLWVLAALELVVLLLLVGFLESIPALKPVFTTQGAFFIRLFVVILWALQTLWYNDRLDRQRRL
jgi:hypothetical protein